MFVFSGNISIADVSNNSTNLIRLFEALENLKLATEDESMSVYNDTLDLEKVNS